MAVRKDLDAWYQEQIRLDPSIKKNAEALLAGTVSRRKLPLLCDECLDETFVAWLRNEPRIFKVFKLPKGRSDEHLWQEARQRGRLIVTADRDFLDDRRYPLHESPGVLHLDASSLGDLTYVFTRFFVAGSFLDLFSRMGWPVFWRSKSSVALGHGQYRSHDPEDGLQLVSTLW